MTWYHNKHDDITQESYKEEDRFAVTYTKTLKKTQIKSTAWKLTKVLENVFEQQIDPIETLLKWVKRTLDYSKGKSWAIPKPSVKSWF